MPAIKYCNSDILICMKIGVWGDSIVYGSGDEAGLGWVGHLANHMHDKGIEVYNHGVGGDTTEDVLRRFETELEAIKPDVVILAVGINDSELLSTGATVIPLPIFTKNIQTLLSIAKQKTNKVIVVGITDLHFEILEITQFFSCEVIETFNTCLEGVAKEMNATYVNMHDVLDIQTDLSSDGIHPNSRGYKKMFNTILPIVESILSNRT